jgi:hypothetical protein
LKILIWKENNKINALGYVLITSVVLFAFPMWDFLTNWHDFKGLYLTDLSQLQATQGKVIQSYVYTSQSKRTTLYHYQIAYAYHVDGAPFQSDEVTFGQNYLANPKFAEAYQAKYPMNAIVTVFYDPKDPTFAVLEPTGSDDFGFSWLSLYLSAIGLILSVVMAIWKLWSQHKQETMPGKRGVK